MTTPRERELGDALAAVRDRLARAADAAGRDVADIELLPVTKFFPAGDVVALHRLGCDAFGESRDQEATQKVAAVREIGDCDSLRWHMVGRIQRNKARSIAEWAYAAHSVDSAKVAAALDRGAVDAMDRGVRAAPLRVFVQLSLDGDESRGGVDIAAAGRIDELCATVDDAAGLHFVGLMAVPPRESEPDKAFARLQQELARVQQRYSRRLELSAGMSGDLEAAVKHGSTCVRVGTAVLGSRPLTSPEVVTPVTQTSQTPEPAHYSEVSHQPTRKSSRPSDSSPQEGSSQ